jgi:hypothetical protein
MAGCDRLLVMFVVQLLRGPRQLQGGTVKSDMS